MASMKPVLNGHIGKAHKVMSLMLHFEWQSKLNYLDLDLYPKLVCYCVILISFSNFGYDIVTINRNR